MSDRIRVDPFENTIAVSTKQWEGPFLGCRCNQPEPHYFGSILGAPDVRKLPYFLSSLSRWLRCLIL